MTDRYLAAAIRQGAGKRWTADGLGVGESNCVIFAKAVCKDVHPAGQWTSEVHRAMMISEDTYDPWSPIRGCEMAGIGRQVDAPQLGRWHWIQMWKNPEKVQGGHSVLYCEPDGVSTALGLVVDMSKSRGGLGLHDMTLAEFVGKKRQYRIAVLD